MGEAREWRIATGALAEVLPRFARLHGDLHLSYDLPRDRWIVVNDAGYAIARRRAVGAIRAALAEYDEGE